MLRSKDASGNISDAVMGLEATPGTNLVSNSGFESGSTEPWETTGTVQTVTYDTYSGGYALKLLNPSGIKTSEMAAEGDASYLVSYWSRSSAATSVPPATVSLAVYQDNDIITHPLPAEASLGWKRLEQQVLNLAAAAQSMHLAVSNTTGAELFLDQVVVGKLPQLPLELAPGAPEGFSVTGKDGVSADLEWEASTGPFGVKSYQISYKKQPIPSGNM